MKLKDALAKLVGDRPARPAPDTTTEQPRAGAPPTVDRTPEPTSDSSGSLDITFSVRDRSTDS